MAPPKLSVNVFFRNELMLLRGLNVQADMGSVPEFSASVHKRRMIRRWPENAPKMSRNRGNVSDLLTGKYVLLLPPPPTEADPVIEITENFCYYPPPPH